MSLESLAQHLVERYGLAGLFLGMTVESAGVPLPSEVLMPLGGFLSPSVSGLVAVVAVGTLGNLAGSWIAYGIGAGIRGRLAGPGLLARAGHWAAAQAWWDRWGSWAVLVGRFLPGVRTYISFPAGAARMPGGAFSAFTLLGSAAWSLVLAWLGFLLRTRWHAIGPWFHRYTVLVLGLAVLAVVGAWAWHRSAAAHQSRPGGG
jgi:membrane protein DedA with SNARE-associated domain